MARYDWIVCYDLSHPTKAGQSECLRCGCRSVTMAVGMTLDVSVAAMRAFAAPHRRCRPQEVTA